MLRSCFSRSMMRGGCCLAVMLGASLALAQTEFSAEIVNTEKSDAVSQAKIYLAKDKMRVEPTTNSASSKGAGMGRGMGAIIFDMTAHTSTVPSGSACASVTCKPSTPNSTDAVSWNTMPAAF